MTSFTKNKEDIRHFKLILLGQSTTGKSSLVLRFVKGQFHEYQLPTIGAAFFTQTVCLESETLKLDIWDTGGQERYNSITPMFFRDAEAAIVVYDITNQHSFSKAKESVNDLKRLCFSNIVIALAANKSDLNSQRVVPFDVGKSYADDYGLIFMETSAKTAVNVTDMFVDIAKRLSHNEKVFIETGVDITKKQKSWFSSCCSNS